MIKSPQGLTLANFLAAQPACDREEGEGVVAEGRPPAGALEVMARLGDVQAALRFFRPGDDAGWTVLYTSEIVRALDFERPEDRQLGIRLLNEAVTQIGEDREAHYLLANLLQSCPRISGADLLDFLGRVTDVFNRTRNYWPTARVLCELARLGTCIFTVNVESIFPFALRNVLTFTKSDRSYVLRRLFDYWAVYDVQAAAQALDSLELPNDVHSVRTILVVARATAARGDPERLRSARREIIEHLGASAGLADRAAILTELAGLEFDLGDVAQAGESIAAALGVIAEMVAHNTNPETEDMRRGEVKTARIRAAAVHLRIDAAAGRRTLVDAWACLLGPGPWDAECIETLVKAQLAMNPKALAALIAGATSATMQSALLIEAARQYAAENPMLAKRELTRALSLHNVAYPEGA
jgi:hypothetical protein